MKNPSVLAQSTCECTSNLKLGNSQNLNPSITGGFISWNSMLWVWQEGNISEQCTASFIKVIRSQQIPVHHTTWSHPTRLNSNLTNIPIWGCSNVIRQMTGTWTLEVAGTVLCTIMTTLEIGPSQPPAVSYPDTRQKSAAEACNWTSCQRTECVQILNSMPPTQLHGLVFRHSTFTF